jgi:hypothetical protein
MSTTKNILECVQNLPIELIREIKYSLDPETQIMLLKNKPSVYANVKKTVNKQYVNAFLKEPSMNALRRGLKKEKTKFANTVRDEFGNRHIETYYVDCKLPGNVIANMYEINIHKPMLKALKKAEENAPMVIDLDGKMKPCITPLEKSIISRFKMLAPPVKPTYINERITSRHTRAMENYHYTISYSIAKLLEDFDNCTSFIKEFNYAIRMSSLKFFKALVVLSKQYLQSPVEQLLSKRTPEDIKIDKNRWAYYAKNNELVREEQERYNMANELFHMKLFMTREAKIREQHAKEQRKLNREEVKVKKLQEKEDKQRLKEERANKKAQLDQEKALRAVLREQTRANKIAEMTEKYTFKMLRTMFV